MNNIIIEDTRTCLEFSTVEEREFNKYDLSRFDLPHDIQKELLLKNTSKLT